MDSRTGGGARLRHGCKVLSRCWVAAWLVCRAVCIMVCMSGGWSGDLGLGSWSGLSFVQPERRAVDQDRTIMEAPYAYRPMG